MGRRVAAWLTRSIRLGIIGGRVAQTIAIRHPRRVRSLVSIMSTTGNPSLPPATPAAMAMLMTPAPADREGNRCW
jgi:pimeloyl-ACP methyl ester carboxylesterase